MADALTDDELIGPDEAAANLERMRQIMRARHTTNNAAEDKSTPCTEVPGGNAEIKPGGINGELSKEVTKGKRKGEYKEQPTKDRWPVIARHAYHGLAGDVVRSIEPHTESDPVAILLQFLACFGNAVGRGPYYQVEGDQHFTNIYTVLVGQSSKARKGTSASRVRQLFKLAEPEWQSQRVKSGLSSGEGLIAEVRDTIEKDGKDGCQLVDPGVDDKRLMAIEPEFAGALTVMQRHGNILSRVVRDAWDGRDLGSLVKNNPQRATAPLISIVGHITEDELRKHLDQVSMANGYANRFLFACVRRARELPHGGNLSDETVESLALRISTTIGTARSVKRVTMTAAAGAGWERVYGPLSQGQPGLLGSIVARAEAQTIRLALLYALLDGKSEIEVIHLRAALAVWGYCDESARYIFGDTLGDPIAEEICNGLRHSGDKGMTRTEISKMFSNNRSRDQIGRALDMLKRAGKAKFEMEATGGKSAERWFFVGEGG